MAKYSELLKNPRWQRKRLAIFERDNWACQLCKSTTKTLAVHHTKYDGYKEPWDYEDAELMTVCEECHESISKHSHLIRAFKAFGGQPLMNCFTCYHNISIYCACREPSDMITEQGKCPDWHPKEGWPWHHHN